MKAIAYYIDENVDEEIAKAAEQYQNAVGPRIGKGVIVAIAWKAFKETPEYRRIMGEA